MPYPPGGAGYPAQAPGYPQAPQPHVGGSKHGGAIAAATGTVLPTVCTINCWPSEARPTSVLCDKGFLVVEVICPKFCQLVY